MLTRNQESSLIKKLNSKVSLLYRTNCDFVLYNNDFRANELIDCLDEYLSFRDNSRIPNVLHYVVLSSIAKQCNLYDGDLEEAQISSLILTEMEDLMVNSQLVQRNSEVLIVGLQMIKSHYPILYQKNKQNFFSIERASLEILDRNPVIQQHYKQAEPAIQPVNMMDEDMFDFVDIQTKVQTQISGKNILIPKKELWFATALLLCFGSGMLLNTLTNSYLSSTDGSQDQVNPIKSNSKDVDQDKLKSNNQTAVSNTSSNISPSPAIRLDVGSIAVKDSVIVSDLTSSSDALSQVESLNLVKKFLESKRQLFAPPYNTALASEIMTDIAYNDYVLGSRTDAAKEHSIAWLRNNGYYYQYGVQLIQSIKSFQTLGSNAVMEVKQLEEVGLYDRKSVVYDSSLGVEEKTVRYSLSKQNGVVKIAGYNVLSQEKRKL
jgi:ARC6-like, IMS domain